jgi:glycosyltransferase involved in cell wall biosynthesis
MRIALVAGDYAGVTAFTGGIGGLYAVLCPALVEAGHSVRVIAPADGEPRRVELGGVEIHTVPLRGPAPLRPLAWGVAASQALRRERADVVLAAEYTAGAWRYARDGGAAPLVTHLHTSVAQVSRLSEWSLWQRVQPANVLQSRLERDQTRRSHALLAPTQSILDWTSRLWDVGTKPAGVVPNAVDVDRVRRLAAEGSLPGEWPAQGPIVLFAGRLEKRKGVHVLARAMQRVWAAEPSATLVLAGPDDGFEGGWMSEHVKASAGRFAGAVRWIGVQAPEQLYPALAAADIVALPSLWENFSIVALEAMASGASLVVSSAGGFPEFIAADEDALMVAPGDADALAGALIRLLGDAALRRALATQATASAERYRASAVAPRFTAELERLAAA